MADVPTEAPHKVAGKGIKGGLGALKKLPPVAWVFIIAGIALVALYIRHQQSAAAATSSDQNAGATADQAATDTGNYSADTSQLGYLGGYQDGLAAGGGALGGFGSVGSNSTPVSDPGLAGTSTGTTLPSPTGAAPIDVTVNNSFPTGGGAPAKPAAAHAPVGSKAGAHGAVVAPYGSKKPPAKKGYRIVGTGHGGWIYVPLKK